MPRVHNHYDNLKIARDASPDTVRSAYRGLTRQHHPDRNPDDGEAARIMALVNVAYSVLSDPVRRREHDEWIERAEAEPLLATPVVHRTTSHRPVQPEASLGGRKASVASSGPERGERMRAWRRATLFGVAGLGLLWGGSQAIDHWPIGGGPRAVLTPSLAGRAGQEAAAGTAAWVRGPVAPNGQPWPEASGYLESSAQLNTTGLSDVTADNGDNGADMLVKLVSLDGPTPLPVRTVFVAANGRFVMTAITSGLYDLRWRNLRTGALRRTPPFILEEVSTARGLQPTRAIVELEPHGAGQPRPYALGDGEF